MHGHTPYTAKDPESDCTVRIAQVWDVNECAQKLAISIDDAKPTFRAVDEILGEYPAWPELVQNRGRYLAWLAMELLRQHINSDAHADLRFVELAAR